AGFLEGDVADNTRLAFRRFDAVDADIDDHGARLDPVTAHQAGTSNGNDEDIRRPAEVRRVLRARMRHGDGAVFGEQQLRHRLADDVRLADDDGMEAGKVCAEAIL